LCFSFSSHNCGDGIATAIVKESFSFKTVLRNPASILNARTLSGYPFLHE
jgi:hypothetical protein